MCLQQQVHQGRVALVTGSSRGLGREVALQLAEQGATVVVHYRQDEIGAHETLQLIERGGGISDCVRGDVSDPNDIEGVFHEIEDRHGRLDIFVNNAGYPVTKFLQQSTNAEWDALIATNLRPAFICTRLALPMMRRNRWGRIIIVGSAAGALGGIGQSMYAASKGGLIGLTRSVARETAMFGITVNLLAPGFMVMEKGKPTILSGRARRLIPMGRYGEHKEVAAAAVFLASPEASYITGQVIFVDGGVIIGA